MFNFQEEVARYQESLTVEDLSGGVSGDEVRDILDIAKQLVEAGPAPAVKPRAMAPRVKTEEGTPKEPKEKTPGAAKEILTASSDGEQA